MFATTGIIQGNTVLTNDYSIERYNGRKFIITVFDEDFSDGKTQKPFQTVSDETLLAAYDALIQGLIQGLLSRFLLQGLLPMAESEAFLVLELTHWQPAGMV